MDSLAPIAAPAGRKEAALERLVTMLIETPSRRLALCNTTGIDNGAFIRATLEHPRVRGHFLCRTFRISCDDATTSGKVVDRLGSELGLHTKDDISAIISNFSTHERALVILENLDAIYPSTDLEQQEDTDVLLASLARNRRINTLCHV